MPPSVPMKKKKFTNEFRAKVALEAIKGERTVNKIASVIGNNIDQFPVPYAKPIVCCVGTRISSAFRWTSNCFFTAGVD